MPHAALEDLLAQALAARRMALRDTPELVRQEGALRLLHGYLEGLPDLAVDLYARTLVLHVSAEPSSHAHEMVKQALRFYQAQLPWIDTVLVKWRSSERESERRGLLLAGTTPARKVREHGVWYALDLTLNLDASLYLDTRHLRAWALRELSGLRVLNTFAYTGSLGVAAAAGKARQVIQTDKSRRFLNLAKDSYALNGLPVHREDFRDGDFWTVIAALKRANQLFDCVFVDPPFFSQGSGGVVDLVNNNKAILNKLRPLVAHGGRLVSINNALFVSGAAYSAMLESLCADGYMTLEEMIPVPEEFAIPTQARVGQLPADPAPFNHSTKIAVLRVRRKDQRV